MKTALVVMAAGIGSRYGGGVKQLAKVGPSGENIIDYSVRDALEAGFDKVIFIINRRIREDFVRLVGSRIAKIADVSYAFQEMDDLPEGFSVPGGRIKPWGTGQAVLAAEDLIDCPFAVINADDYYGKEAYRLLHEELVRPMEAADGKEPVCMAGFVLENTLSGNGGVTRGICVRGADGKLLGINETSNVVRMEGGGAAVMTEEGIVPIDGKSLASMNMWGFSESFLGILKRGFPEFLKGLNEETETKKEYLLPVIIDGLLREGRADVRVLMTNDIWFGITYQEDREEVQKAFKRMVAEGKYPASLYES